MYYKDTYKFRTLKDSYKLPTLKDSLLLQQSKNNLPFSTTPQLTVIDHKTGLYKGRPLVIDDKNIYTQAPEVHKETITQKELLPNQNYIATTKSTNSNNNKNDDTNKLLLYGSLALAGIIAAYLIFK